MSPIEQVEPIRIASNESVDLISKDFKPDQWVDSPELVVFCLRLVNWYFRRIDVSINTLADLRERLRDSTEVDFGRDLEIFVLNMITSLPSGMKLSNLGEYEDALIKSEDLGNWLQARLEAKTRKKFAVNFTQNAETMINAIHEIERLPESVVDPFSGSGRLVAAIVGASKRKFNKFPSSIVVNDINPIYSLLAFCKLKAIVGCNVKITATVKNGFDVQGLYDFIITNPPFTKMQLIDNQMKNQLREQFRGLDISNQSGLHLWAILHCRQLMSEHGTLLSVLPSSILNSKYSKPFHKLILANLAETEFVIQDVKKSFSDESDFKELFMVFKSQGENNVNFSLIDQKSYSRIFAQSISKEILEKDWNWDRYFRPIHLQNVTSQLKLQLNLVPLESADVEIKRGIEIYGPNFFFFPNVLMDVSPDRRIITPKKSYDLSPYLKRCVRQPKKYRGLITPEIFDFTLSIEPDKAWSHDLIDYVKEYSNQASVAQKNFGETWVHHIYNQIEQKNPKAHLILLDKVSLSSSSSLFYYFDNPELVTKNFYVVQGPKFLSKLLASWFSSSYFLVLYLGSRREIGEFFGRMQIIDYRQEPLIPSKLLSLTPSNSLLGNLFEAFDELRYTARPAISEDNWLSSRSTLDKIIKDIFDIKLSVRELYSLIQSIFSEFNNKK